MARGFGTTLGAGTTDKVVTTYTTPISGKRSYFIRANTNGLGGGGSGRLWDKRTALAITNTDFAFVSGGPLYLYASGWSLSTGTFAEWSIPQGSFGIWNDILIAYDNGSTANAPVIYLNGVSQTVSVINAPAGTPLNNADPYVIGNRGDDSARCFDGQLQDFAIWDGVLLNAREAVALHNGVSPFLIRPAALAFYDAMHGNTTNDRDSSPHNAGAQVVTGTAFRKSSASWPILMAA